jgi:acyl-CoA reductase-like NAD-dependent aldehyde dehydrogenase
MASELQRTIATLRGAVIECRFENVRYRQDQLHALYAALRENSGAIREALEKHSRCTVAETESEFYLTMDAVQKSYESLDFEDALNQEYLVTKGENNTGRRVGIGLIVIRPQRHSRFYSIVSPVVAALAAGNCILLEV